MSTHKASPSRRVPLALATLSFALTAAVMAFDGPAKTERPPGKAPEVVASPFKPVPASNPTTLQLQADERQVHGWVSGTRNLAGKPVSVKVGTKSESVSLDENNSFCWPYKVTAATTAAFSLDVGEKTPLTGSVALAPVPTAPGPCAFFVVDRTAYRPGQLLHFAAFLRTLDEKGEFTPLATSNVVVNLVSQRKATKVASLKLTSDDMGRVVGSYKFTDGDPLDHYTLSMQGYKGSANVLLGEYRKSKIKLKISGKVVEGKMTVTLEGLDFLDKPIAVTRASLVAQVVRQTKKKNFTLNSEDFIYHEPRTGIMVDIDSLAEEDLLFAEAESISSQTFLGLGNTPLTQVAADLKPEGDKPFKHAIDLKPEWLRGDCSVIVQGVITDANGREQRASTTLPIAACGLGTDKPMEISTPRKRYFTCEGIEVKAKGLDNATLVVMKLAFQTPSAPVPGIGQTVDGYFGRLPAYYSSRRYRPVPVDPEVAGQTETVRRTLVSAIPFKGDTARLTLKEPGAYKLIAVATGEDGIARQIETTIVVKRYEDTNALTIRLDREEFESGAKLTGVIHSRFKNPRALLTLRDSTGIRATKPITFKDGTHRLDMPLPGNLRYGCTIDVIYPEDDEQTHVAHAFVRVVPKDRILDVAIKTPDSVQPGSKVDIDLSVNRNEPVDLIVSCYDQSLLGIAADRSTDIRNFFLADERASATIGMALVQRRLGEVTIGTLYIRAQAALSKADAHKLSAPERAAIQQTLARRSSLYVYAMDLALLLRLAGIDVYLAPHRYGTNWHRYFQADEKERVIDLLKQDMNGWHLVAKYVGNTLLLHETHTSYRSAGYLWHPVYGWSFDQGYGYGYGNAYRYGGLHLNSLSAVQNRMYFDQSGLGTGGRGMARGDGSMTWNSPGFASGNSALSFAPEAQGFISHLPAVGAPVALLDSDPDQGHIGVRRDFSDSAFWNATVRTDETGKARVSFKLPDSLTNWQVVVTAVSRQMHVGSGKASFRTFRPIMVWPMLPRTFTEGDRIEVFASVHNRTEEPQKIKVRLKVENGTVTTPEQQIVDVPAKSSVPVYWTFLPGVAGFTQLLMSVDSPAGSDASLKRLPVVRSAAEQLVTVSGIVKDGATIEVPGGVDPKASRLEITFAPSLAADMADTLNYLVDYPYGCVEQTMSRFLPAIKVAQILRQFKVQHPELEKKLPGCVAGGIKRLLELQQPDGGWGWNGNGATHEMMTPYALYGLLQAEKAGHQIPNEQAVTRGLARLEQFIQGMGDAQTADRIYCMYVFSHRRDLQPAWWTWVQGRLNSNALSDYALALSLEMAVDKKQTALAKQLAEALRARAQKTGTRAFWQTAGFSRWAEDRFEITAVALKALVAFDKDDPLIDQVLGFFAATKRGDRWNSTKDTAMILYAMCDYLAKSEYNPQASKRLSVAVNEDKPHEVRFEDQLTQKVTIPGTQLKEGKNTLAFKTAMTGVLYRAVFRYWKSGRDIAPMEKGISVARKFLLLDSKGKELRQLKSGDTVPRGSFIASVVEAKHHLPVNMRYVLVENPRPSTAEPIAADDVRFVQQHQQCTPHVLREDREAMTCFHHEETAAQLSVRNVFLAELAGDFAVPPAVVEMMYQTETRGHSGSFVLKVK